MHNIQASYNWITKAKVYNKDYKIKSLVIIPRLIKIQVLWRFSSSLFKKSNEIQKDTKKIKKTWWNLLILHNLYGCMDGISFQEAWLKTSILPKFSPIFFFGSLGKILVQALSKVLEENSRTFKRSNSPLNSISFSLFVAS